MQQLRIGIDCDDVLIHLCPRKFFDHLNEVHKLNVNYAIYAKTHSWEASTGLKSAEIASYYTPYMLNIGHSFQEPVPGAKYALSQLGHCHLHLVTARPKPLTKLTTDFLMTKLNFSPQEKSFELHKQKGFALQENALTILIEDSAEEIKHVLNTKDSGVKTIIYFPSFKHREQPIIRDPRVINLKANQGINDAFGIPETCAEIQEEAWREATEILLNP